MSEKKEEKKFGPCQHLNCPADVEEGQNFCHICGNEHTSEKDQDQDHHHCRNCGSEHREKLNYCDNCGHITDRL